MSDTGCFNLPKHNKDGQPCAHTDLMALAGNLAKLASDHLPGRPDSPEKRAMVFVRDCMTFMIYILANTHGFNTIKRRTLVRKLIHRAHELLGGYLDE